MVSFGLPRAVTLRVVGLAVLAIASLSLSSQASARGIDQSHITAAPAASAGDFWVTGWYAGWLQDLLPPSEIDFDVVTHLVHFTLEPAPNGSLGMNGSRAVPGRPGFETPGRIASVVDAAHSAGREVLVTIGGAANYNDFRQAIRPGPRGRLVQELVTFVTAHGYDGVDLDLEPINPAEYEDFKALVRELRAALPSGSLITVAGAGHNASEAICAVVGQLDQVNIMTYDLSGAWAGWVTWHNAPIYSPATFSNGRPVPSADLMVQEYRGDGCPASKLAIGMDFWGYVWTGVNRPLQGWGSNPPHVAPFKLYSELASAYDLSKATWDEAAGAAYLSTGNQFVSFDNERTAAAKVQYARSTGLGGLAIWELAGGYLKNKPAGQRDPLLQAVKQALR